MAKVHVDDTVITIADDDDAGKAAKPLRKIPDVTGIPIITAIKDRIDFFYNQGQYRFFETRVAAAGSTVLRLNMIPGPLCADPRVVALCDSVSFTTTLFDPTKVDKSDSLTGSFSPSTGFTGGHRVCNQLDPSDPTHAKIKQVFFNAQAARKSAVIPAFLSNFDRMFDKIEAELASSGRSAFSKPSEAATFDFFCESLVGPKPGEGVKAAALKYVFYQFHPIMTFGYPRLIEDILLHTFPFPSFVARRNLAVLAEYFGTAGAWIIDDAERAGVGRDEAMHHLISSWVINGFMGLRVFLVRLFKWVVSAGPKLHARLAAEVRAELGNGEVSAGSIERMEVVKSAVWEALRVDPPLQLQYGRARRDMVVESHEARYEVRAGEMLCGFQPMATRDPLVFERAEEYVADRFLGEGRGLLKHVLWSNGPETGRSEAGNKVCAGKDLAVLVGRLMLVVMFRRYDEVVGEVGETMEDLEVIVTELRKKTAA